MQLVCHTCCGAFERNITPSQVKRRPHAKVFCSQRCKMNYLRSRTTQHQRAAEMRGRQSAPKRPTFEAARDKYKTEYMAGAEARCDNVPFDAGRSPAWKGGYNFADDKLRAADT